jgi:hypothetical protein
MIETLRWLGILMVAAFRERRDLLSVDFFTVPTVTFRVLFVFVVLSHSRRRVSTQYSPSLVVHCQGLERKPRGLPGLLLGPAARLPFSLRRVVSLF